MRGLAVLNPFGILCCNVYLSRSVRSAKNQNKNQSRHTQRPIADLKHNIKVETEGLGPVSQKGDLSRLSKGLSIEDGYIHGSNV